MSYGYAVRRQTFTQPKRPLGVALLAGFGIFNGLLMAVAALWYTWFLMQRDFSMVSLIVHLSIGLGFSLYVIWVHWGLWDLLSWAWWMYMILGALNIVLRLWTIVDAPNLTLWVMGIMPFASDPSPIYAGLISGAIASIVLTIMIMCYLYTRRKAFLIGMRHQLAPWDR